MMPSSPGDPHYVFLFLKRREDLSDTEYRKIRLQLLLDYCHVVKIKYQNVRHIVGFASEAGDEELRSEDLIYIDGARWTAED